MLRFDVPPVWSNVTRLEAFISFLVSAAALLFTPWLMVIPAFQGFVRGFLGHHKCPAHHAGIKLLTACNRAGKQENAGAKMFANKVLFLASTIAVIAYALGSSIWVIPVTALVIFTTLEWAFSFCAACWAYGAWYSKFPPKMG